MTQGPLPFFVYGTLLPGEHNHDRFLRGRTRDERPAVLPGALLYEGPGYPYATDGHGTVTGSLVTAAPDAYPELLRLLDGLEEYVGPDHPRNLYERVVRTVLPRAEGPAPPGPVRAWVYLAATAVARSLRTGGTVVPGGDWLTRRPPPAPRTP
ncbi:gamma-glutamylcyclotransferase [Streptomyces sp. NBC_00178]|uniref:gamma-glutamylcyclotransferase family protein n=1 Tax=Streptomyces sp. NBC_00178 TaxID=2975672 RepID=UPI002E29DE7F|nr:gamma-glutamylcyclotransferase family protein [Streptomyces sp. NBC_00178]